MAALLKKRALAEYSQVIQVFLILASPNFVHKNI